MINTAIFNLLCTWLEHYTWPDTSSTNIYIYFVHTNPQLNGVVVGVYNVLQVVVVEHFLCNTKTQQLRITNNYPLLRTELDKYVALILRHYTYMATNLFTVCSLKLISCDKSPFWPNKARVMTEKRPNHRWFKLWLASTLFVIKIEL